MRIVEDLLIPAEQTIITISYMFNAFASLLMISPLCLFISVKSPSKSSFSFLSKLIFTLYFESEREVKEHLNL